MPLAEAAARCGVSVATLKRAITDDQADKQAGHPVHRVPGGRKFGTKYVIFRAVFERAVVEGIEPDAPHEPEPPVPFLRRRSVA
ncbi:MAG: hypothetical protein K0S99_561 [Thermomicrobiales bacterium]|jgi:hypothetical protein|nr:hypothetical protein [Thermomicrobiales bacterium]